MGSAFGSAPNENDGGAVVPDFNWTVANGLLDGGGEASLATSFVEAKALVVAAGAFDGPHDDDEGAPNFLPNSEKKKLE